MSTSSYSEIESHVKDIVLSVILLLPYQVYVLSSSHDYLILSFKLLDIFDVIGSFGHLNDEILLHILDNIVCDNPFTGLHTHVKSPVSID